MNRKFPSVLLIALLHWGLIISSAKAIPQAPLPNQRYSAAEVFLTTLLAAKEYAPPRRGTPGRLQSGGAR